MGIAQWAAKKYGRRLRLLVLVTLLVTVVFATVFVEYLRVMGGTVDAGIAAIAAICFVFTLNFGLFGIVVSDNVGIQLSQLLRVANDIGDGKFDTNVHSTRADEIGKLFSSVDDMRISLREAIADAENAKQDAEAARAEAERMNTNLLNHADEIGEAMEHAAAGDFTVQLETETDIEAIERILSAYNEMSSDLSDTLDDLHEFANDVEEVSKEVSDEADQVSQMNKMVADQIHELADRVEAQSNQLQTAVKETNSFSALIEEIASTTDEVAADATRAAEAGKKGETKATEAIDSILTISELLEDLGSVVGGLDSQMDEVTNTTNIIADIAEQTNILALNASIEAARAQDGGDGFGVVADEVKTLAEETHQSTTEIDRTITEVNNNVDEVSTEMDRTLSRIDVTTDAAREAGETIANLTDTVEQVDIAMGDISNATAEGASGVEEVAAIIDEVSAGAEAAVSQAREVAATAEKTIETMDQVEDTATGLVDRTQQLERRLDQFETKPTDNELSTGLDGQTSVSQPPQSRSCVAGGRGDD